MNRKQKHTPGPWSVGGRIETSDDDVFRRVGIGDIDNMSDLFLVLEKDDNNNLTPEIALANARLIAAAPDLLEAAKAAMDAPVSIHRNEKVWGMLVAAIAKAEGR